MAHITIDQAKAKWEQHLMSIPGVTAVGIGLTRDDRQKCIKVFLDRNAQEKASLIPESLEGYPVEVEVRGGFRVR